MRASVSRNARMTSCSAAISRSTCRSRGGALGPRGADQQRLGVGDLGQAAARGDLGQLLPQGLRHEGHDRVHEAQAWSSTNGEHLPGGPGGFVGAAGDVAVGIAREQPRLDQLDIPVAEVAPEEVIQRVGDLVELVAREAAVDALDCAGQAREDPAVLGGKVVVVERAAARRALRSRRDCA
jgi:hypothetical protein